MPTTTMRAVNSTPGFPSSLRTDIAWWSAASTTRRSRFLDRDRLDRVRDVLERVRGGLELVDDLLDLQDGQRVVVAAEQLGQEPPVDLVALVLQPVDLNPVLAEVAQPAQARHGLGGQLGRALEHLDLRDDV